MARYTFQAYPAVAKATFTCVSCGKEKRTRTFRHECTVNPFNTKDDGSVRTPNEVREQSRMKAQTERDQFMRKPLCATCENDLSYSERKALREERKAEGRQQ